MRRARRIDCVKHRSISSPVAGSCNSAAAPGDTYASAFFTAAHTAMASISGGSPTALLRYTFRTLSSLSNVATLNTSGTSVIAGILYVVGEWRQQFALARRRPGLGRHPAHALDEPADDLAAVDAGIDRAADVDQQIDPRHAQLAGEAIDEHLGHRGPLRVIEERSAAGPSRD